jgi:hypothetical protein
VSAITGGTANADCLGCCEEHVHTLLRVQADGEITFDGRTHAHLYVAVGAANADCLLLGEHAHTLLWADGGIIFWQMAVRMAISHTSCAFAFSPTAMYPRISSMRASELPIL